MAKQDAAFTLVEVLVALFVCLLVVTVATSALITSLRAEELGKHADAARPIINRLACRQHLHIPNDDILAASEAEWFIAKSIRERDAGEGRPWEVWEVSPRTQPSFSVQVAFGERGLPAVPSAAP